MGVTRQRSRTTRGPDPAPAPAPGEVAAKELTPYWTRAVPTERFARLTQDMHRAIVAHAGVPDADDALLELVITEAVDAFLSRAGHPVAAALKISGVMRRIGAREAAIGRSFDVFDTSIRIARGACEAYLPRVLVLHPMPEHRVRELRDDLAIYIDQLREHARVGYDRQWSLEDVSPEHAELALRQTLFDDKAVPDPERLRLLAEYAGRVLPSLLQPVVTLDAPLPRELLRREGTVAGARPHEAFVAGALDESLAWQAAASLPPGALLVVGDPVEPLHAVRALGVARRTATMVASGLLARPAPLLRCHDVLGQVATSADPYVLDLLVAKHLGPLEAMSAQRRIDMGELLLEWLETGEPVNELARRHDVHNQTQHARMRKLRAIFGEGLHDRECRVELILALRRELPRWHEQLSVRTRRRGDTARRRAQPAGTG